MNTNNPQNTPSDEQMLLPFDPPLEEAAKPEDLDSLRAENLELKRSIMLRDAREEIGRSLSEAGARSPALMFDAAKDSLQFGEDGRLENGQAIVSELKRKFPEQFGGFAAQPSIDGGAGASRAANVLTKETLARMKPAEIARLDWEEVRQVLNT